MLSSGGRAHTAGRPAAFAAVSLILGLYACGGGSYGGSSGGGATLPQNPTVTVSVAPTTIVAGQSTTVTWSATNAQSCAASGGWTGSQATSGTLAVTPTTTGTVMFTLACTAPSGSAYMSGGGGTATQSATLTVTAATAFVVTNLVTDTAGGGGAVVDPKLVNPWGIVFGAGKPVWTANNGSQTSTLYNGTGTPAALVVSLPADASNNAFNPTGVVFNGSTTDFVVTAGTKTGAPLFIWAGEDGLIAGWSPAVAATSAVIGYTDAGGASYKGLAIANNGTANFLYAADFHNGKVDVFDTTYAKQTPSASKFQFVDPTLPAGYAPFGIQAITSGPSTALVTQIFVAYAKQGTGGDNANGPGLGIVDIFDTNGVFVKRLVATGGALNAPWGLALAPSNFGTLSGALLVGNFGDGKINGYDLASGTFLGAVTTSTGAAFAVPGLWGIAFGNNASNQPLNTLYFAAGTNDEANGEYGRIDLPAP